MGKRTMWDNPEEAPGPPAANLPATDDVLCPQCRGKGRMPGQGDLSSGGTCGVCRGRGLVRGGAGVLPLGVGAGGAPVAGEVPGAALPANSYQHGGDHYKQPDGGEEHWDRVWRLWGPGYFVGNITKYAERCMRHDGAGGLRKCGHYVAKLIELLESGIPPGYMGKAGGKPITEAEVLAMTAGLMADLRAEEEAMRPGPRGAVGACTCGADRTGPSAEAHDPGCPAAAREVPGSELQVLWAEIDVVCKALDGCGCAKASPDGPKCDGCKAGRARLLELRDKVKTELASQQAARDARGGEDIVAPGVGHSY